MDEGLQMWDTDWVEAGGMGDEGIHLRHNRDTSVLNTPQESGRQDSRGEAVCNETVGEGCF